jgi:TIR domain
VSKQDHPLTPSLVVENPDQAVRIRAWWATIEEAIAAAGGVSQALNLVAPESYDEDQLFRLLELDWERFPQAVGKDGSPLGGLSIAWAREVQSSRVRNKLSEWAKAVNLAVSQEPPPPEPEQSSKAVGSDHRQGGEDAGPREARQAAQDVVPMHFGRPQRQPGHAFISYVREDSHEVDKLQRTLEAAGVSVWRDTADLWPGEDWRMKIRRAITDDALAFIACFSSRSVARQKSYQNEELLLAIEQLRLRRPDDIWLIPVRLDDCDVPDLDLGGGRTLDSIQRVDLFGDKREVGIVRLLTAVLRILGQDSSFSMRGRPAPTQLNAGTTNESRSSVAPSARTGQRFDERSDRSATKSVDVKTRFSTAGDPLPTASGHDSKIFEMELTPGRYLFNWSVEGKGGYFSVRDESEINGRGKVLASANPPNQAKNLDWTFSLTHI